MPRESPLMKIWEGNKLVGLVMHCNTASQPEPTPFEWEIVRIFEEHIKLEAENKRQLQVIGEVAIERDKLQAENKQQADFLSLAKEEMDSLQAKNKQLKENYSLLEDCSPPNWPRKDFVKHLFQLWEKENK